MPRFVTCADCGYNLNVTDGSQASKASCPVYGAEVKLAEKEPEPFLEMIPLLNEEPRPNWESSITEEEPKARKKKRRDPDEDENTDSFAVDEEEDDRPRKRKRVRKPIPEPNRAFVWIMSGALGIPVLLILIGGLLGLARAGHSELVTQFLVSLVVGLPISVVILILSMFISSAVAGGIEFGEAHIVLPKAVALLLVINLIGLIPLIGAWLALPVWWLGLMNLFHLDLFEVRVLALSIGASILVARYLILAAILSGPSHTEANRDRMQPILPAQEVAYVNRRITGRNHDLSIIPISLGCDAWKRWTLPPIPPRKMQISEVRVRRLQVVRSVMQRNH